MILDASDEEAAADDTRSIKEETNLIRTILYNKTSSDKN